MLLHPLTWKAVRGTWRKSVLSHRRRGDQRRGPNEPLGVSETANIAPITTSGTLGLGRSRSSPPQRGERGCRSMAGLPTRDEIRLLPTVKVANFFT
jgi:hypothetical protein